MKRIGQLHLGTLSQQLKRLDAYPKIAEDFRIKTVAGAAISIVSAVIIFGLVVSEFVYYLSTERVDHLQVDTALKGKLQINFDVTFNTMGCDLISVGVVDVSGESYYSAVEHDIKKRDVTTTSAFVGDVKHLGEAMKHELGQDEKLAELMAQAMQPRPADYCGSCYGASPKKEDCCNSCKDVEKAYAEKGWAFLPTESVEQCVHEAIERKLHRGKSMGCKLQGSLTVNKVAGNVHFVPGKAFQSLYSTNQDFLPFELLDFNMSHTINHLSFGQVYPGIVNPLDGVTEAVEKGIAQFQYFVKVVPTDYKMRGKPVHTNQYSVTQHTRIAEDPKNLHFNPGVFVIYDLSPVKVSISQRNKTFASFLVGVCAIVGGVFTVAGMVDSLLYHGWKSLKGKLELGKQN